jgi:hypothetical protein
MPGLWSFILLIVVLLNNIILKDILCSIIHQGVILLRDSHIQNADLMSVILFNAFHLSITLLRVILPRKSFRPMFILLNVPYARRHFAEMLHYWS